MSHPILKSDLSWNGRLLLQVMSEINFGRIHDLRIVGGDPVFEPTPRVTREIKFSAENGPRPESEMANFTLRAQVIELFATFQAVQDGAIEVIEVKHGLPFRVTIEHRVRATYE